MIINGESKNSVSGETYEVRNPATSEMLERVPKGAREDAKAAIDAASDAFNKWSNTRPMERAKLLLKATEIVESQKAEIAHLITLENGKPLQDAIGEMDWVLSTMRSEIYANTRLFGDFSQNRPGQFAFRRIEPIGVCGILLPFNNPGIQWACQVPIGLMTGNALVIKPASTTPLAECRLVEALVKAGLPAGVVNYVIGPGSTVGEEIVTSRKTHMISLTGENDTGVRIMQAAAPEMKRLSLNLGGSDPLVVCDDGDIEAAVSFGVHNRFRNTGQGCMCVKRIFVVEKIYETYLRRYIEETRRWTVGNGLQPNVKMGPLHTANGRASTESQVDDAIRGGAKVEAGAKRPGGMDYDKGFFYMPTVLTNASYNSKVAEDETFGPVVPIWKVKDIEEAIERSNNSPFGLTGTIFTSDLRKANKFVEEHISSFNRVNPVGGITDFEGFGRVYVKKSGFGTEGLEAYTRKRPAVINGLHVSK
jgi:succinate-semialdehyde dehydrogenase/glutarate-semialdehyde dehydrogenase